MIDPQRLVLLPGFLGEASDFALFQSALLQGAEGKVTSACFDWMTESPELVNYSYTDLAEKFWQQLEIWIPKHVGKEGPLWILGYSLGGRIALALRASPPMLFQNTRYIFVSTNPGLSSEHARSERFRSDQVWAQRFREEDWDSLIRAWNAQPVLATAHVQLSRESQKSQRANLVKCLENWSLAKQPDYFSSLQAGSDYAWFTGERDEKFTALAKGLQNTKTISQAAHRVPMEAPVELAEMVLSFMKNKN